MSRVIRAAELERGLPSLLRQVPTIESAGNGAMDDDSSPEAEIAKIAADDDSLASGVEVASPGLFEQGYIEGFAAGREAGACEVREMMEETVMAELVAQRERVAQLKSILERLGRADAGIVDRIECQARHEAVELAVLMAERVLHRELDAGPDLLVELMDELLRHEESPTLLEIRVAPHQRSGVVGSIDPLCKYAPDGTMPRVLGDPDVADGFMLVTDRGGIDARIHTQVRRLGQQLKRGVLDDNAG